MVPGSWRVGHETFPVDSDMFSVAQAAAAGVTLPSAVPPGDVACIGVDPRAATTVAVTEAPQIRFAADKLGFSADGFGDRAFPCIPGGGDVFGCRPCRAPDISAPDVQRFATGVIPFVDPNFFSEYGTPPAPDGTIAVDMETGAVAKVAGGALRPFIAFRGASDGNGDPLMLPGFPFQFFVYRQLAADNAARVTLAFLDAWAGA